jgi:hypothetical protein
MTKTSPVTADIYTSSTKETLREITVVNPGEWFGKVHLLGVDCGYSIAWYLVEADSLSDVIDIIAEHKEYGQALRVFPGDVEDYRLNPGSPPDEAEYDLHYDSCGNPYSTEHIHWGWDFDAGDVTYYAPHLPQKGCRPEDYTDDGIQAFLAVAWNYAEEHAGEPSPIGGMCTEITETKNAGYADWELLEARGVAALALVDCLLEAGYPEDNDEIKAFRVMAQECL